MEITFNGLALLGPVGRRRTYLKVPVAWAQARPPASKIVASVKAMVAAMREADVPAVVSNTAGTFVCNHLMYGVLHLLGYDHAEPDEEKEMFGLQRRLLLTFLATRGKS